SQPHGKIDGMFRIQPVTLALPSVIPSDSVLARIPFVATLGNTSGTFIVIDSIRAIGTTGASCVLFEPVPLHARFVLDSICLERGMRLVTSATASTGIAAVKPNPAVDRVTVDFSTEYRGIAVLSIYSVLGNLVMQPLSEHLEPGSYSCEIDVRQLSSGIYYCVLQTPNGRRTHILEVIR
ncbi:MAG: T9SS type A sorting domain-containing protein, partial [Bacteroidota bacterium]|nr:T9SS type A sorting domain-containing protein [Candidatus Kapabacteria bacterium]MDW8221181.1 T9SS type A sorting domain-containing protein [Bacteroidota bacterium]